MAESSISDVSTEDLMAMLNMGVAGDAPPSQDAVDLVTGAPFLERVAASFKSSPESAANYFRTKYGQDNVRVRSGEVQFRKNSQQMWVQADPSSLEWGDVADLIGEIPELIGGGVGAILGGTAGLPSGPGALATAAVGAAGGTAAGNVVKQAVGTLIPGQDVETLGGRALNVGGAAAMGAGGEVVGRAVQAGVVRPTMRWALGRAKAGNVAGTLEAEAIERGINRGAVEDAPRFQFTPGEASGSRGALMFEDYVRGSVSGADTMFKRSQENLAALQGKVLGTIDELRTGARPMSDMAVGQELGAMWKQIDGSMQDMLEDRAAREFGFLNKGVNAADVPVFKAPNLRAALQQMIQQDTTSGGIKGGMAEGAEKILEELPKAMTVRDVHLYLKRFGTMGYGKGDKAFLERMGDSDRTKAARRLFSVLSQDLDDLAAREGTRGSAMARQLQQAKNNYARGIDEISSWQDGLFKQVVGEYGPESAARVVDNLRRLNGDEMKSVMTVIGTQPEIANAVRANWVERAMLAAQEKSKSRVGSGVWFNPRTFLDNLGKPEQINAMFGSHRQVLNDVTNIQRAVARMTDKSFVGESPTAGRLRTAILVQKLMTPTQWASAARDVILPERIAKILLDPRSRHEVEILANAKAPTRRAVAAITYLLGDQVTDASQE